MAETSGIEWTDATWNPWYGCHKVSPACAHCYAERDMTRYGRDFDTVTRASDATFYAPLKWKEPRKVFTCSWSDFFIEEANEWRVDALRVIAKTPRHTYQVLTKRPEQMFNSKYGLSGLEFPWPNVWLGVSCENERFYGRVSLLVEMPAVVHYLSIEPMLGDMRDVPLRGIEWVIVGTESGSGARFTDLDWIRRIRDKCKVEGVAFFVKQLTTKGGIKIPFESWPEDLQVREMPGSIVGRSK